jgi:hypothetical protein
MRTFFVSHIQWGGPTPTIAVITRKSQVLLVDNLFLLHHEGVYKARSDYGKHLVPLVMKRLIFPSV